MDTHAYRGGGGACVSWRRAIVGGVHALFVRFTAVFVSKLVRFCCAHLALLPLLQTKPAVGYMPYVGRIPTHNIYTYIRCTDREGFSPAVFSLYYRTHPESASQPILLLVSDIR